MHYLLDIFMMPKTIAVINVKTQRKRSIIEASPPCCRYYRNNLEVLLK